jgi:hypothetical protein
MLRVISGENLSSDATHARQVHELVLQLIEIHKELLENNSGVWMGSRVEL